MTKHGTATARMLPSGISEVVVTLPGGRTISGIAKLQGDEARAVPPDIRRWALSPSIRDLAPERISDIAYALEGEQDAAS